MPLKARALSGRQDVILKRLCQYEVPGGGQCRDASCEELHVWELEPSDQDTAQFLAGAWPFSEAEIIGALRQARKTQGNKGPSSLETRVAESYGRLIGQRQEVKSA
ncbi:hypothetical protein BD410DRAFT_794551 [Rickenella mellea]|uniref:Zinc-finger domain-containing protein n=1 Tax=Rickenella mellea TaxID=50990 RepID=A0A4Y7PPD5_9AGAM|nr:hypothetical protein BD410DRAFT_794551 [Rickenella mellea]